MPDVVILLWGASFLQYEAAAAIIDNSGNTANLAEEPFACVLPFVLPLLRWVLARVGELLRFDGSMVDILYPFVLVEFQQLEGVQLFRPSDRGGQCRERLRLVRFLKAFEFMVSLPMTSPIRGYCDGV